MASLEIHDADGRRAIYEILDSEVAIGSGDGCGLRIRARGIADRHLRLVDDGGVIRVEDLGGGLQVNGDTCDATALAHGDQVDLGEVSLLFLEAGSGLGAASGAGSLSAGSIVPGSAARGAWIGRPTGGGSSSGGGADAGSSVMAIRSCLPGAGSPGPS